MIYDNLAQNAYIQAKVMRRHGHDVELLLTPSDPIVISDPRWEELDLELPTEQMHPSALPAIPDALWVQRVRTRTGLSRWAHALAALARMPRVAATALRVAGIHGLRIVIGHADVIRRMRGADIVITYGMGPVFAGLAGVPCLASTYGADIVDIPFADDNRAATPVQVAEARLQRWGLRRAAFVLVTDPRFFEPVERLGLTERSRFVPFVVDTEKYAPGYDHEIRARFLDSSDGILVLNPSRQHWSVKGSDIALKGFARAARHDRRLLCLCAGWGVDLVRSQALVDKLGIADRVRFLPYAMSKSRLLRYYHAADIVMDQFTIGSYGTTTLEALSCARPLVTWLESERFAAVFDEPPPIANARTATQIGAALGRLAAHPELRASLGARARAWVVAHHGDGLVEPTVELGRRAAADRR